LPAETRGYGAEIVYVLQRRDEDGFPIDPTVIRTVLKKCDERGIGSLLECTETELKVMPRSSTNERSFLRSARLHLTHLRVRYDGFDPRGSDVWDTAVLGLEASRQRPFEDDSRPSPSAPMSAVRGTRAPWSARIR
jgi:hypothetical protein